MHLTLAGATAVALAASTVVAQTFTDCDPTKRRDCKNPKALGSKKIDIDWRKGKDADNFFYEFEGTKLSYDKELGAVYPIKKETDAPTTGSNAYIFFGRIDLELRASPGKGIVSSIVFQSDDLDEIDWEWVGYDSNHVQTNYFSKGCNQTYDRGAEHFVNDAFNNFHTYSIDWTPEKLDWLIDGQIIRTIMAKDVEGKPCGGYPQSPMQIRLGAWVGGKTSLPQGTIEWSGGLVDWSAAPFNSYYKSVRIVDYMGGRGHTEAKEYHYTDLSGKASSIKIVGPDGKDQEEPASSSSSTKGGSKTTATTLSSTTTSGKTTATPTPSGSSSSDGTLASITSGVDAPAATGAAGKVAVNLVGAGIALLAAAFAL